MLGSADDWPVGSVEWAERISNRLQIQSTNINRQTSHFLKKTMVEIFSTLPRTWEVWPKDRPFETPDDYCRAVTGHDWNTIIALVREFDIPNEEQDDLFSLERTMLTVEAAQAELARAQAEHRGQGMRTDQLPYDIRKCADKGGDGGTSTAYLLRRLARTHPDVLDAYERGEFKSVRQAALSAGIVKDRTPLENLRSAWFKASPEERETFLKEIHGRAHACFQA